jgi:sortase B
MRRKKAKAWLYVIPVSILVAVLVISSGFALRVYLAERRDQNSLARLREEIKTEKPPENETTTFVNRYESVMEQNADFACWLNIPDTSIDYPVMKTSEDDPEFYLRRGFDKEYSFAGTLFIGGGCNLDSDSFIIYGHNMDTDTMFGELDRYADPDYALKHRFINIGTPTEDRVYRVYAAFQTRIYSADENVFKYYEQIGALDEPAYRDTVAQIRSMSMFDLADAPQYPAQLLFLSTCSYHTKNGRFVVAAYRTYADEKT